MIIDFHTHIFPDHIAGKTLEFLASVSGTKPFTTGTGQSLKLSMESAGIDVSVVLPVVTRPSQFRSVNTFAAQFQNGVVLSFGGIHPESPDYKEELREISRMGLKGIKLHPDYQETYFDDIRYKRIVSYASELGLIVSVHAGVDPKCPKDVHCTPKMAAKLIDEVRPPKLVLAHMGGNELWDEVEMYLAGKEVYLDTGVVFGKIPDAQFLRIVNSHGADRILFATDSPWSGQRESAEYLEHMQLTPEVKEKIFYKNASELLERH